MVATVLRPLLSPLESTSPTCSGTITVTVAVAAWKAISRISYILVKIRWKPPLPHLRLRQLPPCRAHSATMDYTDLKWYTLKIQIWTPICSLGSTHWLNLLFLFFLCCHGRLHARSWVFIHFSFLRGGWCNLIEILVCRKLPVLFREKKLLASSWKAQWSSFFRDEKQQGQVQTYVEEITE